MTVLDEKEIYQSILKGDQEGLDFLINTYSASVYRLVSQILKDTGNSQDIEECCSDAFLACWNNIQQYQPERAPLKTFILMKAKYVALDRKRKLSRKKFVRSLDNLREKEMADSDKTSPENKMMKKEQRQNIMQALQELSSLDKKLVYRRYFLHEKISDLAAENNMSRHAVDSRLWRARKLLKSYLQENQSVGKNIVEKGGSRDDE